MCFCMVHFQGLKKYLAENCVCLKMLSNMPYISTMRKRPLPHSLPIEKIIT